MVQLGAAIDKLMGQEVTPCEPDDFQALALFRAGVSTFSKKEAAMLTPDTKLSGLGSQKEVQGALGNLSSLYISGSLAEDIIDDATVGDVISHLDSSKVSFVIDTVRKEEKAKVSTKMHHELDSLKDEIS